MKSQRALSAILIILGVILLVYTLPRAFRKSELPDFDNAPRLLSAVRAYTASLSASGEPVPTQVSLRQLVNAGFLNADDTRAFKDVELIFFTRVDPSKPQEILALAMLSDGTALAVLADGSVQGVSANRLEELKKR